MFNCNSFLFKKSAFIILMLIFTILFFSEKSRAATLTWDPNPDAEYYVVYCSTVAGDWNVVHTTTSATAVSLDLSTVTFKGGPLSPGVNYSFAVKAFNACGNSSDYSDSLAYLIPVPNTINTLGVTGTKLGWTYTNTVDPATSYRITYSTTTTGAVPTIVTKTIIVNSSVLSYDLCSSTFLDNVQYTFTVSACNSSGVWGAESNSVTYTRRSVSKPSNLKIR